MNFGRHLVKDEKELMNIQEKEKNKQPKLRTQDVICRLYIAEEKNSKLENRPC